MELIVCHLYTYLYQVGRYVLSYLIGNRGLIGKVVFRPPSLVPITGPVSLASYLEHVHRNVYVPKLIGHNIGTSTYLPA